MKNHKALMIRVVVLLGLLNLTQCNLLHHPDHYTLSELSNKIKNHQVKPWPDPSDYRGLMSSHKISEDVQGVVLLFHGNQGSALDRLPYLLRLAPLNYRVILLEYPGYGPREGKLDEASLVKDGVESVTLAKERFGKPIYLIGESLGAGVASAVLREQGDHVDGVLLITPWDNLVNVAKSIFWFLPIRCLLGDSYDSVENLKGYQGRVGCVISEKDEIIPFDGSLRLYDSIKAPKKKWIIPGAKHNAWFNITTQYWWAEVMEFISKGIPDQEEKE